MRVLQRGMHGEDVEAWQAWLRGQNFTLLVDGVFGPGTQEATEDWQNQQHLITDGIIGPVSLRRAVVMGWQPQTSLEAARWEVEPMAPSARDELFGGFEYEHTPSANNPEKITVDPQWRRSNIVRVRIPQTKRSLWLHKRIAHQFAAAFDEIEKEGMSKKILTFNGSYVTRFIRGSRTTLSNHAYGTAVDINARWNRLGEIPAHKTGSVRDLVPIFVRHGIYWGGYFRRPDAMHFEVFEVQ